MPKKHARGKGRRPLGDPRARTRCSPVLPRQGSSTTPAWQEPFGGSAPVAVASFMTLQTRKLEAPQRVLLWGLSTPVTPDSETANRTAGVRRQGRKSSFCNAAPAWFFPS